MLRVLVHVFPALEGEQRRAALEGERRDVPDNQTSEPFHYTKELQKNTVPPLWKILRSTGAGNAGGAGGAGGAGAGGAGGADGTGGAGTVREVRAAEAA